MKKGMTVERDIDGAWFRAIVESFDHRTQTFSVRYPDGNVEEHIAEHELRIWVSSSSSQHEEHKDCQRQIDARLKPLSGLIEDDWETRRDHKPTVVIHESSDLEEAIIINGTESKLAAGGGLRALRYLRH